MGKVPGQAEARLTQPEDIAARVWNWAHSDHRPVLLNLRFFARLDDFSTQGTPAEKPAAGKNACPTRQAMDIQLFAEAALCHHILMTCSTRQMQTGRGSGHDPALPRVTLTEAIRYAAKTLSLERTTSHFLQSKH